VQLKINITVISFSCNLWFSRRWCWGKESEDEVDTECLYYAGFFSEYRDDEERLTWANAVVW